MDFTHYDLGQRRTGEIVEVQLQGSAANVQLMDSNDFSNYRNGRDHHYYGGHVTHSPYRVAIPRTGHWHVTIDLGGYGGSVSSSVEVLPGA